ncbi:MAG: tetratricopeptide repeat protein [Candidatus Lokiarchaeota archaeon]|nr:tetratricopeptide repeat protein [Candidatus Lokiarchaeota archaeon]
MAENKDEYTQKELEVILNEKLVNLKELEQIGKDSNYIHELGDIALIQLQLELFRESEKNYLLSLKYFQKQKDKLGQAAVYGVLGTLYYKMSDYQKSIEFYEYAFDIYGELKQIQEQITCLKGIGDSHIKLNQYDDACDILLECSALCSDNNDVSNLLDCLGNLIQIYETQENWDIVFELYKKSLEAFKELEDIKGIIISYFNLGILKKRENDLYQSIIYFKKGTNNAIDSNYTELILKGLSYVGEILVYQGEMNEAKDVYIKALSIANKVSAKNSILQIRILLNSLGLSEDEINKELNHYLNTTKNSYD